MILQGIFLKYTKKLQAKYKQRIQSSAEIEDNTTEKIFEVNKGGDVFVIELSGENDKPITGT